MPQVQDFSTTGGEDFSLIFSLTPPTNITNWSIRFQATYRFFGVSGLVRADGLSGYTAGQSGVTVLDPIEGRFQVDVPAAATSGLGSRNLAYAVFREDFGARNELSVGYISLLP